MRKGSFYIFLFVTILLANAAFLFLMQEAGATKFPMPDIKGQVKKEDLKTPAPMELQADQVSFNSGENKAIAQGNVDLTSKDQQLYCDQLQLDRAIQQAVAEGHVYLDTPQEQVQAQGLTYNFNQHTGEFRDARVFIDPYQVEGKTIDKVSETHMILDEGYMTTCDLDEPHYRIGARRMDVYQKDKAIARDMKVYLGKIPVMYLPYYVQDLKNRPILTIIPGEKKDFGLFLLSTLRLQIGSHVKLALHADVRERTGFGEGFDIKYDTPNFGSGIFTAYYTDENQIASHHLWDLYRNGVKVGPTTHHERYRLRWRHQWQIDKNTTAIWQVYKIHDYDIVNNGFLKEYFQREYNQNADVNTYLLLTRVMPHGTLTFNVNDTRINRPLRGIDRFPEITYTFNNQQIGKTGFYAKSVDTYSNLSYQNYPKTFNEKTQRFDTNNDISHPFKVGFITFNPHAGGENTYYSRTADVNQRDIIRGLFRTSLDIGTKFYRIWNDYKTNFAGMHIDGLRHVVTPTITYLYQAKPTFPASRLNQFDPNIDNLYRINQLEYGLENKLQTKRDGHIVDLLRLLITANYGLKTTTGHRGLDPVDTITDFSPCDWLSFHDEYVYDFHAGHFNSDNFSGTVHSGNWSFGLGNDYARGEGDQITTEFKYTINPKWKFRIYNRFPLTNATAGNGIVSTPEAYGIVNPTNATTNSARENEFVLTRDLHEWEMDLTIDQQEGHGSTFYVLFRLKAFPDMKLDLLQTSYQPVKPGSQS